MTWLWALFGIVLLLDALRMRGRAAAIPTLPPSDEPVSPEHRFLAAPGVALDEPTKRAASAYARSRGIAVLDLCPRGLPALWAWGFLQFFDPEAYRKDRLGRGTSFGQAVLVDAGVLARAGVGEDASPPADSIALVRIVGELKRYACTGTDLAVAPSLGAARQDPKRRLDMLRELVGDGVGFVIAGTPIVIALVVLAAVTGRIAGLGVLALFHLQPLIAFAFSRLRPRGVVVTSLLRTPLELWGWLGLVLARRPAVDAAEVAARRDTYDRLLSGGLDPFFEPRLDRCPICNAEKLGRAVATGDLLQHKPGRFVLDRCGGCGHVFQNPRLSLEGLDFYYRDFYDGLGAENLDRIFGTAGQSYLQRARMVQGAAEPARWLDVGGGHGHFCCAAREVWKETRFDGLDLSESIEEAVRRGWVDKGYRGLFPELAKDMAGTYDVVSMSHYLEHTREPAAEIEAASVALSDGGLLLIEVPDPECPMGRLLGRLWLPWFQPQHQHLLSVKNLERLLRERGFSPLVWHRGEAHQRVDFLAAVILALNWLAPEADVPWRPGRGRIGKAFRTAAFTLAIPALIAGRMVDALVGSIVERTRGSNTYRVLARKVG